MSKINRLVIVVILLTVTLIGCAKVSNLSPTTVEPTSTSPTTVEPTTVPPTSELPINNISQDELDKLYALFGDIQSWYSRALLCEYDSPESLCLFDLFHTGFEGENNLTAAEQDALTKLNAFDENYDYRRLPVDKINLVLTEYFGITIEQIEATGFDGLVYLENTNCYYLMANDAKFLESFDIESAYKMDNGNICLRYQADGNMPVFEAILVPVENGYQILSNKDLTLDDHIKQAYLNKTGEKATLTEMSVRHIDSFDDIYAVFVDCTSWVAPTIVTDVQVGDYLFSFSTAQEMWIYKNGACYSLTEVYDQKLLTDDQWQMLLNTWKALAPQNYEGSEGCDDDSALDCQIKQAFIDREWKDGNFNDLQVRYVYSFGETHAVFVDCALFNYTTAFTSFQIGNYPFNFNDGQAMYVFKDGVLATLEEAYAQNMLFEEQWKVLHDIWKELNPIAYAD